MSGQVLPSAEGNIRQKMADLHLELASQEVIHISFASQEVILHISWANNWASSEEKDAAGVK